MFLLTNRKVQVACLLISNSKASGRTIPSTSPTPNLTPAFASCLLHNRLHNAEARCWSQVDNNIQMQRLRMYVYINNMDNPPNTSNQMLDSPKALRLLPLDVFNKIKFQKQEPNAKPLVHTGYIVPKPLNESTGSEIIDRHVTIPNMGILL